MMSKVCQAKELTHISLSSNIVGPANHEWQSTDNYEWCSGDGYIGTHIKMCRCTGCFVGGKNSQNEIRYSLISHQTGATFWTPLDQIIALIPVIRASVIVQTIKEIAPTFHDWNIFFDRDASTSMHAKKFAMGTRGNVGFMEKRNFRKGEELKLHRHNCVALYTWTHVLLMGALSSYDIWSSWRAI